MTRLTKFRLTLAAFALAFGFTALNPPPAAAKCVSRSCSYTSQCRSWCLSATSASCSNGYCVYGYEPLQ